MSEKKAKARPAKGFPCPECVGVRLFVYRTETPRRGLIVRYRKCSACGFSEVTEERSRAVKARPKKNVTSFDGPA